MSTKTYQQRVFAYLIGYFISLICTFNAYVIISSPSTSLGILLWLLISLAVGQLISQLIFFLHLGQESKPRWRLLSFLTMIMVVFFIVGGSVWIMNNLNYNMTGDHASKEIMADEGMSKE